VVYKKTEEGYEFFHSCWTKQQRDALIEIEAKGYAKAIEDAIKAVCLMCQQGVTFLPSGNHWSGTPCPARRIRELKEGVKPMSGTFEDGRNAAVSLLEQLFKSAGIQAPNVLLQLRSIKDPSTAPKATQPSECNRHSDCDAADAAYRKREGRDPSYSFHCHDDECEDCFGC
jgi:hypothetical protein